MYITNVQMCKHIISLSVHALPNSSFIKGPKFASSTSSLINRFHCLLQKVLTGPYFQSNKMFHFHSVE